MESFRNLLTLLLSTGKYVLPTTGFFLNNNVQVLSIITLGVFLFVDLLKLTAVLYLVSSQKKQGRALKRIKVGATELEFEQVPPNVEDENPPQKGLRIVR